MRIDQTTDCSELMNGKRRLLSVTKAMNIVSINTLIVFRNCSTYQGNMQSVLINICVIVVLRVIMNKLTF